MSAERLVSLLERIWQASSEASDMLKNVEKAEFLKSIILQRAVGMSLLMAAESVAQLMKSHPEFIEEHPEFEWSSMRGMRNRIAHNYFDIDLEKVWATAKDDLPDLLDKLHALRHWRAEGE